MKEPFDQELLSAYLDGELTAAQQARVERLLAENPKAKQLLDELRALSATLQSLPQEKIGEDLSPYVLRQAERELLTGNRPTAPARLWLRQMLSHMLSRRALTWAAAAVVIAVFFTITEYHQRRQERDRAVAVGRAKDRDAALPAAAPDERAPTGDLALPAAGRRPPSIHAPGVAIEDDQTPTKPSADTLKAPAAPRVAEKPGWRAAAGVSPTGKDEQLLAESKPAPGKETAATSSPEAIRPGEHAVPREGGARGALLSEGTATAAPMPEAKPGLERPEGVAPGSAQTAPLMVAAGRLRSMTPVADGAGSESAQVASQSDCVVVVRCDITPEAARNRALDQLLVRNNIALEDDAALAGADQKSGESRVREDSPVHAAPGRQLAKEKADTAAAAAAEASGLDVVYVEAAPEQLEPVLAAMNAMPSQFLTVTVEPPPQAQLQRGANLTANQYDFSRYSRAKPAADSQQPGAASQEPKSPVAAPPVEARVYSAPQGAGPGGAVALGKGLEEQSRAAPGQPGDKASAGQWDGDGKLPGGLGQQIGGFSGRAVRVQLPQKRAADNVVPAITNNAEVGKRVPGSAGVERSEAHAPLGAKGAGGFAGSGMAGPPEVRPGYNLSGKGKVDTGAAALSAEAPASAAKPVAAPQPEPADPGRDRPQGSAADAAESAQADDQAEQNKSKAASGPAEQQQLQQTGGVCRVLFVIRVVPEALSAESAEPAAEKSQARE